MSINQAEKQGRDGHLRGCRKLDIVQVTYNGALVPKAASLMGVGIREGFLEEAIQLRSELSGGREVSLL